MTMTAWVDSSRHNGPLNGAKLKARGFHGIFARCAIGVAERDPLYLMAKEQAEDNGLEFAAYGVSWPANRDAKADAQNFVEKMAPSARPKLPLLLVGDHELGLHVHPAGHHLLTGAELVDYAITYNLEVEAQAGLECWFYTATWYWNSPKLKPHIDQGERALRVVPAHYPFDPPQVSGQPPRYSPDVLNPAEHGTFVPLVPKPWTVQDMAGLQWTSKGKGAAAGFCTSAFLDRDFIVLDLPGSNPTPAPPSHEQRIAALEAEARARGWGV